MDDKTLWSDILEESISSGRFKVPDGHFTELPLTKDQLFFMAIYEQLKQLNRKPPRVVDSREFEEGEFIMTEEVDDRMCEFIKIRHPGSGLEVRYYYQNLSKLEGKIGAYRLMAQSIWNEYGGKKCEN